MKSSNRLNKALKEALDGKPAPLREAQWERLQAELGEKKEKRGFLPWFFLLMPMLLIAAGIAYYALTDHKTPQTGMQENNGPRTPQVKSNDSVLKPESVQEPVNTSAETSESSERKKPVNKAEHTLPEAEQTNASHSAGAGPSLSEPASATGSGEKMAGSTEASGAAVQPDPALNQDPQKKAIETERKPSERPFMLSDLQMRASTLALPDPMAIPGDSSRPQETVEANPKTKVAALKPLKPKMPAASRPRFALGLAGGFAFVNTSVSGLTNEQKLHKDTRSVFEQSTERQRSGFLNLNFDWRFFHSLNFGLSTGLQYRVIGNKMDVAYTLREVPMRGLNGDIVFYFNIGDSLIIKAKNSTAFRFVNVPVKLSYAFMAGARTELQLSGGPNFSLLAGSSGYTISLNEGSTRPVGEMVSQLFDVGYTAGLMASRQIYKQWWLGLETQFQRNHLNYDLGYGILKSKMDTYNLSVNLRYRF